MKIPIVIALCAFAASPMAAEIDSKSNVTAIDRYVADTIETETLPNGEVITRLVSKHKLKARQFWVDSVYGSRQSMLVFQGSGATIQVARDTSHKRPPEQNTCIMDPTWNIDQKPLVQSALNDD